MQRMGGGKNEESQKEMIGFLFLFVLEHFLCCCVFLCLVEGFVGSFCRRRCICALFQLLDDLSCFFGCGKA